MTVYANELDFIHAQLSQDRQTTGSLELLYEYRNACEQKQEQIDSAKDVIKSLTAELAKARGRGGGRPLRSVLPRCITVTVWAMACTNATR